MSTTLGRDLWTLTPDQITSFLREIFIFTLLYNVVIAGLKISIIFLYLRIFPDEKFRRVLWLTQIFLVSMFIAFLVATLLQCDPMSGFWTSWDREHDGSCNDLNALAWSHASVNIALDFWLLALPAWQVRNLNVSAKKKCCILGMFGLGIVYVCSTSLAYPLFIDHFIRRT